MFYFHPAKVDFLLSFKLCAKREPEKNAPGRDARRDERSVLSDESVQFYVLDVCGATPHTSKIRTVLEVPRDYWVRSLQNHSGLLLYTP